MRIEALRPLKVKLPNGHLQLTPGEPVDLPDHQAEKLLLKAPGAVRVLRPRTKWLQAYQELARVTNNITKDDSRFLPVLHALDGCDAAFEKDDWQEFVKGMEQVIAAVGGASRK